MSWGGSGGDATQALDEVHIRIGPYFDRQEMRDQVRRHVASLLSQVARKNSGQLTEALDEHGRKGSNAG